MPLIDWAPSLCFDGARYFFFKQNWLFQTKCVIWLLHFSLIFYWFKSAMQPLEQREVLYFLVSYSAYLRNLRGKFDVTMSKGTQRKRTAGTVHCSAAPRNQFSPVQTKPRPSKRKMAPCTRTINADAFRMIMLSRDLVT